MARYFFHLRDSSDETLDREGSEFGDMESLKAAVMRNARDVIAGDIRNGVVDLRYRIDAETDTGQVVYSLAFKHAFDIIPEARSSELDGELP